MRGRGGGRGGSRGRGGFSGGRGRGGGFGGGGSRFHDEGPPAAVIDLGCFMHPAESDMVYKCSIDDKVPYFNAAVYLENKTKVGQIDEVFGPINELMFTVKPDNGVVATSFTAEDRIYINPEKLLPRHRFTDPEPEKRKGGGPGGDGAKRGRGGFSSRGGSRGGFGGRGGRGGSPGRGRGGFGGNRGGGFRGRGRGQ